MAIDTINATAAAGVDPARAKIAGSIRQAASTTGASFEYLLATAKMESNFNPKAAATTSSARGLFQFIDQTWLGTVKEAGAHLGYGKYADAITRNPSGSYSVSDPDMRAAIMRLRNDPDAAKRIAVKAIDRALAGLTVPTVVHLCFGYAAVVHGQKPTGYSFLPQLADCTAQQISIEAAQPKLDLGMLRDLSGKTIMLGVIDLKDTGVETPEQVADRIRDALKFVDAKRLVPAPDCGMKYLARDTAFGKLKALSEGAAMVRRDLS